MSDKVVIYGGGTFSHIACHLALAAPAFGTTARQLGQMFCGTALEPVVVLTKMADNSGSIITNTDLIENLERQLLDESVKAIVMNATLCDFFMENPSDEARLSSKETYDAVLRGINTKAISIIKQRRPDIVVAGFKTTKDASVAEQLSKAFLQVATSGVDFVLANDVGTHSNILVDDSGIVTRGSRDHVLNELVGYVTHKYGCKQWGI